MSETQNNEETEITAGMEALELPPTPIPQAREVILPVIMSKKDDIVVLGDGVFNPETSKMTVSFNTEAGREIAEFIGSGILAAVSFAGHISADSLNKN